jgi:hypothetical protein
VEVDLLRQRVKVRMEDAPETISIFPNTDIAVLRSGKAKKTDPPIPADLAPISGNGKRIRKTDADEEKLLLEPIRFKYSTERIVEEKPEEPVDNVPAEAEEPQQAKSSRSRRRRGRGQGEHKAEQPKSETPKAEQPAPKEKKENRPPREPKENHPPKESSDGAAPEHAKKPGRRPNHRRHRKPKPHSEG